MKYKLENSTKEDIEKLIEYKLDNILLYSKNLPDEKIAKINEYVECNVKKQLDKYKNIIVKNKKVGCLLVNQTTDKDYTLLDEIYIEEEYRNNGIGTSIIKEVLKDDKAVHLWVYKNNTKAISLYKKLGFEIEDATEERYYMRYSK